MARVGRADAARYAEELASRWRFTDAADQEAAERQSVAIATIFLEYPDEVLDTVVHPVRGLAGRLKWFPSLAEIKQACDEAFAPLQRQAARELELLETHQYLGSPDPETPEQRGAAARFYEESLRPVLENAMPLNEQMRGQRRAEVAQQIRETPEETGARLSLTASPVMVGDGLAKKLDDVRRSGAAAATPPR